MKKLRTDIFVMMTVLLMTACTGEMTLERNATATDTSADDGRVAFMAYLNRSGSRAGEAGELVLAPADGKRDLQTDGFGVMAYHTEGGLYNPTSIPNFMYNQKVTATEGGTKWDYEPMMYWPNNTIAGGSDQDDHVSFFAYAPWVKVNASTGRVTDGDESGITSLTASTAKGDPRIRYAASLKPSERVDLCWADPKMNQTRPADPMDKLQMQFHHALASLNVLVDAYVDKSDDASTHELASETRLWIRSVTFEGFTTEGALNLNQVYSSSVNAGWTNPYTDDAVSNAAFTVKDGRADGLEGRSPSANERPVGLNPVLVQSMTYSELDDPYEAGALPKRGVYNDLRNLFDVSDEYTVGDKPTTDDLANTSQMPLYVIPTDRPLRITVEYDIETRADNLPGYLSDGITHGISLPCKVSATVKNSSGGDLYLSTGKAYTVRLHLGVNSVQFAASVNAWGDVAAVGDIEIPVEDLSISEIMLNVYVNDMEEQDPVLVSLPLTDLSDLADYFEVGHVASEADEYLGKGVDKNGYIEGITGSKYNAADQVGFIGYISTDATDVDAKVSGSRILVAAVSDASTATEWKTSSTEGESAYNDRSLLNGYEFSDAYANDTYPAAKAAFGYVTQNAGGPVAGLTEGFGLSGFVYGSKAHWFLPSAGQWDIISHAIPLQIWSLMPNRYWTATESSESPDKAFYFEGNGNLLGLDSKNEKHYVRAVFAY